ncbi:two-component sensor histidine kinase [Pseudoclavibacter sp. RFBJ3]|uniref:sensor histidine kinase n=1 Tax=unclassified Pseudoclavibacter TaxID=2615177 RepID=UPI000CE8D945|nr:MULTISPECIES: sensor histidine kinase [unclassified Pseudoclavibacter]PPF83081.1 two-component sensor histidine kinase [Pseudoclavibacter sp. RFBJ5]PPF91780.1 two-component sensor histidine kinase [Pseudoclavibacter sp. RFBJ3]PPF96717.1 two-component sensor histidine kinase [Pseudoclavibacter sp. RFBH5]PPG19640.1 two-component sensor histidine kinase [Pseudoclavibacter sp. RFBI4]
MPTTALTPVFVGLRTGLHALSFGLLALVAVRAVLAPEQSTVLVLAATLLFGATYALGAIAASRRTRPSAALPRQRLLWLLALTLEWMLLLWLSREAAYLVFPLFFVYLHLLGRRAGMLAVAATTAIAVIGLGLHEGWSVAGVIGPCIGAGVAVLIGIGYEALAKEAREREQLMRELLATQEHLVATEREAGTLTERSRLAREIHDTVAQGLASIQMLLHAAERADPDGAGVGHIRLARETAADNLAETRRFIRELAPPDLDGMDLEQALRRLADATSAAHGIRVEVHSSADSLPMPVQTALLRIAQGAIANVVQHAGASRATITLDESAAGLVFAVADDGRGFDASTHEQAGGANSDSFGLVATRERVQQLGGSLDVTSSVGQGTTLTVTLPTLPREGTA